MLYWEGGYGMTEIVQLISSVGFPIVCCLLMFYYIKNVTDKFQQQLTDIMKEHKEETKSMETALNNNTLALQKLSDKLGMEMSND